MASAGVQVQLVVSTEHRQKLPTMSEIQLVRLPRVGHRLYHLGRLIPRLLIKGVRYPRDLYRLLTLTFTKFKRGMSLPDIREHIFFLVSCLPFVGMKPDVIHFQWSLGAVNSPLVEFFGSPIVVSCRGSQINIAPHNPRRSGIQGALR
jgi:hypothetical protein